MHSRQPSPYTSPRQVPSLTGETNNHVLVAILSLVKELNLDGECPSYCPEPYHTRSSPTQIHLPSLLNVTLNAPWDKNQKASSEIEMQDCDKDILEIQTNVFCARLQDS